MKARERKSNLSSPSTKCWGSFASIRGWFLLPTLFCLHGQLIAGPTLYITNSSSNTLSVVDAARLKVVAEIAVGKEPFGLAFSPDRSRAYVANAQSGEISVIDAARHRLIQSIALDTELPVWVAVGPDGTYVYVTNERSNNVAVIAAASNAVVKTIPVGKGPAGIIVSLDSQYAYVANEGSNNVSLINLQTEKVINTIPVGSVPQGLALSPDGVSLYVANYGSNSISIVAAAVNQVVAEIPVGKGPVSLAVSPDGKFVYTGNFRSGSLSIVDTIARKELHSIPIGAECFGVAASPDGREIYAVSGKKREVSVLDAEKQAVIHKIALGQDPFKLAVLPQIRSGFKLRHVWLSLFGLLLVALISQCIRVETLPTNSPARLLAVIFILALSLRVVGLDWGIPDYDDQVARSAPGLPGSFHLDEDNFIWNLTQVRPERLDFYVPDFHWGTLQYHLIELALLVAQSFGFISSPWRESFLSFHPVEYARVFVAGRAVSAVLGSCSILLAYRVGSYLYGRPAGILAAIILALMPLHVVNSHYLTSDVTMTFFLLLAFWRLLCSLEAPSLSNHLVAGLAAGLAVTAKYNAAYILPAAFALHVFDKQGRWKDKAGFYLGGLLGFVLGEPYALVYPKQFWSSVSPYLQAGNLVEGATPGVFDLLRLQVKNLAVVGLGLPLAFMLMALMLRGVHSRFSKGLGAHGSKAHRSAPLLDRDSVKAGGKLLIATILVFVISVIHLRQPLIRYTLPLAVFLSFPLAKSFREISKNGAGRWLIGLVLLLTGFSSLLQVRIFTQPHPANQAFQWVERHLPPEATVRKGWPEIPPLNPQKFRITNFFTQPRMADFRKYFVDEGGQPFFPDYVLLDNMTTLNVPEEFFAHLNEKYSLVAQFKQPPRLLQFELPEWDPPHDWKYSHPVIQVYRRK